MIAQKALSMRRPKKNFRIFAKIRSALSKLNPPVPTTQPTPVVASVQSPWKKLHMLQGRRSGLIESIFYFRLGRKNGFFLLHIFNLQDHQ